MNWVIIKNNNMTMRQNSLLWILMVVGKWYNENKTTYQGQTNNRVEVFYK